MNKKQRKILEAIFALPTRKNIVWTDIEKLLQALGADVMNKGGSVVTFKIDKHIITFHRPHPQKEAKTYMVHKLRRYLIKTGIKP